MGIIRLLVNRKKMKISNLPMTLANGRAAIIPYETLVEKYPDFSTAWYAKGLALSRLRIYDEAMNCFDKALSIDKNYATAWYAKGLVALELKRYDEAMNCFDKALSIDKNYATAWYAKGLALSRLRIYDEAMNCFDRSIKNDPKAAGAFKSHNINVAANK
jgi:tetratricopeptide (TPR) repeat protein